MSEPLSQNNVKDNDKSSVVGGQSSEQAPEEGREKELRVLTEKLKACEAKAEEYLNGWKRAQADYQNLTRRMSQHEAELIQYAAEGFIRKLLSVVDSFDRALRTLNDGDKASGVVTGFTAIYQELTNLLKTHDVVRIEAVGKLLDPEAHEPVDEESKEGVASGVIIEEVRAGYRMGEKVIRPARVKVAK